MEYLRKEERKDCLGMRVERRGTRRAEVRNERVMGFMVVVTWKRGETGNGRYISGSTPMRNIEDATAYAASLYYPAGDWLP